jgi:hypothetical protein
MQHIKRRVDAHQAALKSRERRRQRRQRGEIGTPGPRKGTRRSYRPPAWNPKTDPQCKLTIPLKLDLNSLPQPIRWPAAYLMDLLKRKYWQWETDADGFARLKWEYITKTIPNDLFQEVRRELTNRGIIVEDGTVIPGAMCRGYKLAPDYYKGHQVVCPDPEINAAIHRLRQRRQETFQPVHFWLQEKLHRVRIDQPRAQAIICTLKPKRRTKKHPCRPGTKEYREQRAEYVHILGGGDPWELSTDDYGRVHTPITRLERELRPCLSIDGKPLIWIDLRNSQPLMLGLVARMWLNSSRNQRQSIVKTKFDGSALAHTPTTTNNNLKVYIRQCERGRFYESLMSERDKARGPAYRRQFKERFFHVLFGEAKPKGKWPNKLRDRFQRRYPVVADILKQLKKRNYRRSSHLLQHVESTIFIHRICHRLMVQYPDMPLVTLHDCVGTTQPWLARVEAVVMEEFARLGVAPSLEIKGD